MTVVEQASLIRAITEQVETQDYRRDHDQRINLDLSLKQVAVLLETLTAALRDKRYDA